MCFCSIVNWDARYVENEQIEGNVSPWREGYCVWFWPTHCGAHVNLGDGNEYSEYRHTVTAIQHNKQEGEDAATQVVSDLNHLPLRGTV